MNRPLPQMEMRFKNLSLIAEIQVSGDDEDAKQELPTIMNALRKTFLAWISKKDRVTKHIRNVNGVFKPGSMTLVLGQRKLALMKILSEWRRTFRRTER